MYVYYGKANMKNVNKKDRKIQHLHSIPKTNTKRYSTHDNSIWSTTIIDIGYITYKILLRKITRLMRVFLE